MASRLSQHDPFSSGDGTTLTWEAVWLGVKLSQNETRRKEGGSSPGKARRWWQLCRSASLQPHSAVGPQALGPPLLPLDHLCLWSHPCNLDWERLVQAGHQRGGTHMETADASLPLRFSLSEFEFYFFLKLFILYWGIADQQCCDSFRWTAKVLNHIYTCIYSPKLPAHPGCYITLSSFLYYTVGPCCLFILNIAVCTCPSQALYPFPPGNHKFVF